MKRRMKRVLSRVSWAFCGLVAALIASHSKPEHLKNISWLPSRIRRQFSRLPALETMPQRKAPPPNPASSDVRSGDDDFPVHEYARSSTLKLGVSRRARRGIPSEKWNLGSAVENFPDRTLTSLTNRFTPRKNADIRTKSTATPVARAKISGLRDAVGMRSPATAPRTKTETRLPARHIPAPNAAKTVRMSARARPPIESSTIRRRQLITRGGAKALSRIQSMFNRHSWDGGKAGLLGGQSGIPKTPSISERETKEKPAAKNVSSRASARSRGIAIRPPGMRELLGTGTLKPPEGRPLPPDLAKFQTKFTTGLKDKRPLQTALPELDELENLKPPTSRTKPDGSSSVHVGPAWAVKNGDHWVPLVSAQNRWWTLAQGNQPLLWHADHWWWKTSDGWFLLHEGEPWAFRQFRELKAEGLVHTATGTKVIYSSDGRRAAIVSPEGGTVVYDLESGKELGRWPGISGRAVELDSRE